MTYTHAMHPQVVSYLQNSREILAATEAVADALASGSPSDQRDQEIDSTVDELNKAIARTIKQEPASKGFSPLGPAGAQQPLPIEDQLTIAAADATVAHVLFAASEAVGEQAAATPVSLLRRAVETANADLLRLQPATPAKQESSGIQVRRFTSADLAKATQAFQTQAKEAVETIIDISDSAVTRTFSMLAERKHQILEAFARAGELFDGTSNNAFLSRKAWEKLLSALDIMRQIVASAPFQQTQQYLRDVLKAVSIRNGLEQIFHSGALQEKIDALHVAASFPVDQVDMLSSDVAALAERFQKTVNIMKSIAAIAIPLLSVSAIHFAGPFAPLAVPACCSLSAVAIILLGLDFTRSGLLNSGAGIRKLMDQLGPPKAASSGESPMTPRTP